MLVVATYDSTDNYEGVSRFATDEANNLMVFAGDDLVALYAKEQWKSARREPPCP